MLTDNASPGSSHGMMPGFPVEEGWGYGKIGNCSDIAYLARSANLPKGLSILPMFFLYFFSPLGYIFYRCFFFIFFICFLMVDFLANVAETLIEQSSPKFQDS